MHVKAILSPYNRKADYVYFLAEYMFRQKCEAEDVDPFLRACVFPNYFPFLTALQAYATKRWCLGYYLHSEPCRMSYRLWSLAGRHVERL